MGEGQRPTFRRNAAPILRRHSLQRGLRGYLILFDPRTFVLDWQVEPRSVLSPLVVLRRVIAFHRSPPSTLSIETTSVITLVPGKLQPPWEGREEWLQAQAAGGTNNRLGGAGGKNLSSEEKRCVARPRAVEFKLSEGSEN